MDNLLYIILLYPTFDGLYIIHIFEYTRGRAVHFNLFFIPRIFYMLYVCSIRECIRLVLVYTPLYTLHLSKREGTTERGGVRDLTLCVFFARCTGISTQDFPRVRPRQDKAGDSSASQARFLFAAASEIFFWCTLFLEQENRD